MMNIRLATENRKAAALRLAEITGETSRYTKVPRCAYQVGPFFFEKDGANWVLYWHCTGEGRLWLPAAPGKVQVFDEFAGKPVAVEASNAGVVVPVGSRLYLKTSLSRGEIEAAFKTSVLK